VNLTFDPVSPVLLLFEGAYFAIAIGLIVMSAKVRSEWVRAGLAGFGLMTLAWRTLAILPSWWLYFAEGELGFGGQGCVELDVSCLKQAAKDTVVVVQNAVVLGAFVVALLVWQRRNPKQLAIGEDKPEATGGYK
jgi:hypothetical protein